ncbi:MAG: hypothetical protein JO142_12830 [Burkholderiales bacterium]|nr:hypothetical protein [Burkholderiales bacterium]
MSPDTLFAKIFNRLTIGWHEVETFRKIGKYGLPDASAQYYVEQEDFVAELIADENLSKCLVDVKTFVEDGHASRTPDFLTKSAISVFRLHLDSASLVFAHSILDAALLDLCDVCSMLAPRDWLPVLALKKVDIGSVFNKGMDDLLHELIQKKLEELERESLLKKVDLIFQLCQPDGRVVEPAGFRFDRDRLLSLDGFRHEIVHSNGKRDDSRDIDADLEFMRNCGLHLWCHVNLRYGIRLDPNLFLVPA